MLRLLLMTCLLAITITLACAGDGATTDAPTLDAPTLTASAPPATAVPTLPPTAGPTPMPTLAPTTTLAPTATPEPAPSPTPDGPLVRIAGAVYVVDLAVTPTERAQGLSGRPSLDANRAMLFVYAEDAPRTFWMPDMHFPLDMVWIKSDCTVAGVSADVPNPPRDTPRDQLPRYPSHAPVRFILEINAGQAETHDIAPGSPVQFAGTIAGRWGC